MFRIKICGVRLKKDIDSVGRSGADAIGLNFFPPSVRYVAPNLESTLELSEAAKTLQLLRVGVFVNETVASMTRIAKCVGLDVIQLHGDESPETASKLIDDGFKVIRAVKLPQTDLPATQIQERAAAWIQLGCHLILDADAGASHGGSGKTLRWESVARWAQQNPTVSWTLAGGLKPENVADAVAESLATSVDTASGVECPKGVKDDNRIQSFASFSGLKKP